MILIYAKVCVTLRDNLLDPFSEPFDLGGVTSHSPNPISSRGANNKHLAEARKTIKPLTVYTEVVSW